MALTEIKIDPANEDIETMRVWWYGDGETFISQVENQTRIEHVILIGREAVPKLIAALQQSLES